MKCIVNGKLYFMDVNTILNKVYELREHYQDRKVMTKLIYLYSVLVTIRRKTPEIDTLKLTWGMVSSQEPDFVTDEIFHELAHFKRHHKMFQPLIFNKGCFMLSRSKIKKIKLELFGESINSVSYRNMDLNSFKSKWSHGLIRPNEGTEKEVIKMINAQSKSKAISQFSYIYDLPEAEVIKLRAKTNCEICDVKISGSGLHIDHCHETGKVRGALCSRCNTGLGQFQDNIINLANAINYLAKNKAG